MTLNKSVWFSSAIQFIHSFLFYLLAFMFHTNGGEGRPKYVQIDVLTRLCVYWTLLYCSMNKDDSINACSKGEGDDVESDEEFVSVEYTCGSMVWVRWKSGRFSLFIDHIVHPFWRWLFDHKEPMALSPFLNNWISQGRSTVISQKFPKVDPP